jgi:hypothetical protein
VLYDNSDVNDPIIISVYRKKVGDKREIHIQVISTGSKLVVFQQ